MKRDKMVEKVTMDKMVCARKDNGGEITRKTLKKRRTKTIDTKSNQSKERKEQEGSVGAVEKEEDAIDERKGEGTASVRRRGEISRKGKAGKLDRF